MLNREAAINYSNKFITACRELPLKIDRAILFGSTVKGKASDFSDIDIRPLS